MWSIKHANVIDNNHFKEISSEIDIPLKWAHDSKTGAARYIHDQEVVQQQCECLCPGCEQLLTSVLAGQPTRIRPTAHFRHPPGSLKNDCTLIAARMAATRHLLDLGFIDLPKRRMSRTAVGFSGEGYEVWVELPAERVAIHQAKLIDRVSALLTLKDGRQILVDLTGQREPDVNGVYQSVISIPLSDPEIAMLSPEDIRDRLRILPPIKWCSHWNDDKLREDGDLKAAADARNGLDSWSDEDEAAFMVVLPPEINPSTEQRMRRETLLHRQVKDILLNAASIATPWLYVDVVRHPPDEFSGDWEENIIRKTWLAQCGPFILENVVLERKVGAIVPDVIATIDSKSVYFRGGATETRVDDDFEELIEDGYSSKLPQTLMVEVTVTHGIDSDKLKKIQELNIPTLEINIGSLGGRVTLEGLRKLVVEEAMGKRWVHHPIYEVRKRYLNESMDVHPLTISFRERLKEMKKPERLSIPLLDWAKRYLESVVKFHDENAGIKKLIRQHRGEGPKPMLLDKDSSQWLEIIDAAEALEAHGLPGASDTNMVFETGLVPRILSIQMNRGVGYSVDTGFQVLNAIMQSKNEDLQWHSLYTIAVKAYGLESSLTAKQKELYGAWRQKIIDNIESENITYFRSATYDALLSVLFPGMAKRIDTGYGRKANLN